MLDDVDRRLLRYLQSDPAASAVELAERARVPAATATRRLDRLRREGVIAADRIIVDWRLLGYEVEVSLRITLDKSAPRAFEDFFDAARALQEVVEIQTFLGQVDVRLSVVARDMAHYQSIYRDQVLALPHVTDIEALMHVATLKSDEVLPI